MKKLYKERNRSGKTKSLGRIFAIVILIMAWILIDKGNVYGQANAFETAMSKQGLQEDIHSPMFKGGDEEGDVTDEDDEGIDFTIKPNPVIDDLVFDFEFTVKTDVPYEIYGPLGRLVGQGTFEEGVNLQSVDFSVYKTGMYIVKLGFGDKLEVRRVIKR